MKLIVTHINPDLDALASTWLIKKFLPKWEDAEIEYVSAGSTKDKKLPDINKDIIHVDTGFGRFDHHQTNARTSATKLVFEFLNKESHIPEPLIDPVQRLVNLINGLDHFAQVYYPETKEVRFDLYIFQILEGIRSELKSNSKFVDTVFLILNALLRQIKSTIAAEEEIEKGYVFQSTLGKCIAMETNRTEAANLALRRGSQVVIQKNPLQGNIRIKALPNNETHHIDLSKLHQTINKEDKKGTWFLHASKTMLLNGSSSNPNFIPSSLSLKRIIAIIMEL